MIGMATKLLLIRHGQTLWNSTKRYSGFIDIGLNKIGRLQARELYKRLKDKAIHKIYTSDRKRAIQTAKIVFGRREVKRIPELRELHFGVFEGSNHKELMQTHPLIYKKWLSDPFSITIPQGESLKAFKKRVTGVLKKIISLNRNKTIAMVTHGGAISVFINSILKKREFWGQIPASASLSIIEFKGNKPEILLFNDTTHLPPV